MTGPYEPFATNPVLTQRDLPANRPNPITSAGHADFIDTPNGEWWATFLATRPYGDDFYNTGRETFLMPVQWKDGWPTVTRPHEVIPWVAAKPRLPSGSPPPFPTSGSFVIREDFASTKLPFHWVEMRNPHESWWKVGNGALTLNARPIALGDNGNPSFLARRQQHINATATTEVRFRPSNGAEAGLVALQSDEYWYFLALGDDHGRSVIRLKRRAGPGDPATGVTMEQAPLPKRKTIQLRIEARGPKYDFSWSADGKSWTVLAKDVDGTLLSTKRAGGFVGAFFGVHAYQKGAQ